MNSLQSNPVFLPIAVGAGLLIVWLAGGIMAAILAAALIDLTASAAKRQPVPVRAETSRKRR